MRNRSIGPRTAVARTAVAAAAGLALLAGCRAGGSTAVPAAPAPLAERRASGVPTGVPTGVVIPLYVDPGASWNEVVAAKTAHPNVPIVLIANADSGPGTGSAAYANAIKKAQAAGISVIGYVYTNYGRRPQSTVDAQMLRWSTLYRTNGIFLDQMAANDRGYYAAVTAYAHAHALPFVMGNPGDNAAGNSGPDVINFFEGRGYPALSFLKQRAHVAYGKARWSYMAGAVPFDAATITADVPYVAYLYATNGTEPECYCKLPSYFSRLVALLAGLAPR